MTSSTKVPPVSQSVEEEICRQVDESKRLRKELLGNLDEFICWLEDVEPSERLQALKDRARIAKRLHALAGGKITMTFSPTMFIDGDMEASTGHQFSGWFEFDGDEGCLFIDGRQGNLGKQLIRELQRVGKFYTDLAKQVREKIAMKGVHRSLIEPTAPLPGKAVSV